MKAIILSADNFEDSELLVPYYRLKEAGYQVDVASLNVGTIRGKHGYEVKANMSFNDVNPDQYDLLILPGGKAPAAIRSEERVKDIARSFFASDKPVAAICHGPQILTSAGVLRGRHATCYPGVAPELKEIEAFYEDSEVVVDGNLVTSRVPEDLPAFTREMMRLIEG